MSAYRIVKAKRAADAFSGEGARRQGGRWNSPGLRVVYTAASASLAALEILVHIDRAAILAEYVLFEIVFDDRLVEAIDVQGLPSDRRAEPAPAALKDIGDEWLAQKRSAVLRVPSAVVPTEYCFLLNPDHPDFGTITIVGPEPFGFDPRLASR